MAYAAGKVMCVGENNNREENPMNTAYTVNVTPVGFDDLDPVYEAQVYVTRFAGICGPADTMPNPASTIAQIDAWLNTIGFTRTGEFGDVCANGFATATIAEVK